MRDIYILYFIMFIIGLRKINHRKENSNKQFIREYRPSKYNGYEWMSPKTAPKQECKKLNEEAPTEDSLNHMIN